MALAGCGGDAVASAAPTAAVARTSRRDNMELPPYVAFDRCLQRLSPLRASAATRRFAGPAGDL
jgi:hypothetical protein